MTSLPLLPVLFKAEMSLIRLGKLRQQSSVLFLCDMQEKFRHNIVFFPQIVSVAARMLQAVKLLEMPVIVTEQYPKGLGPTVPELGADGITKYSKTCFSMLTPEVEKELQSIPNRRSVILCGIETQACIMVDRLVALSRMKQSGAFLTTSEGVILQLLQDSTHPKFKEVQKIIMESAPDSGLLSLFQNQNPLFT
ncbi:isochorismatase domain-containing protein 2 isoform X3 [Pseudophryne corroboree]|uniref:isochorismatase domain-containing protein 2 isoform X3 n=1 Tax=Pseudophryne corroboree TaxID=495146 RepID=UPI00308124FB